jgi:Flp pilus assembly protein TadB
VDTAAFRVRQVTIGLLAFLVGAAATISLQPPAAIAILSILAAPALAMLVEEQRVSRAVDTRRARIRAELPVVAEQLGLLLSAGYSLPSAIGRLADRSDGAIAADLRQVTRRTRQGLSASDALSEWAGRAGVARSTGWSPCSVCTTTPATSALIAEEAAPSVPQPTESCSR